MDKKQEQILLNKQHFINYGTLLEPIEQIIFDSWKLSIAAGVEHSLTNLPLRLRKEEIIERVSFYPKYSTSTNLQWIQASYPFIEQMNSVIFSTPADMVILTRGGSQKLLDVLKKRNIGIGTVMSLSMAGTNSVELCARHKKHIWVYGHEHWTEALSDTVSLCAPLHTEFGTVYMFLVTMLNDYTEYHKNFFEYFIAMRILTREHQFRNVSIVNDLVNTHVENKDVATIILTDDGRICYINRKMKSLLGDCEKSVMNTRIDIVFPELQHVLKSLYSKTISTLQEVTLTINGTEHNFYMNCSSVVKNNQIIGLSIELSDMGYIKKLMNNGDRVFSGYTFADLIGVNKEFLNCKFMAERAAFSKSNLLITGESGTGKEIFAQAIHNAGMGNKAPFIPVNCSAIPKELIGSELFGYEEGAFTGAKKSGQPGKFELADKGTLFLDEIAEMPLDMQSVLLRVLEDKKITRLGSPKSISVNVRLIAATNKDLMQMIQNGSFRADLFYRLNVINIELVSLKNRADDIPLLVKYFINMFNSTLGRNITGMSPDTMECLLYYEWPGNVRQLRNALERAFNMATTNTITRFDLPKEITQTRPVKTPTSAQSNTFDYTKEKHNKEDIEMIIRTLEKHNGNKAKAAKELGVARSTLYRKLTK